MGISPPRSVYLDIIELHPVNVLLGINPIGLIIPWDDSIDIIALNQIKKKEHRGTFQQVFYSLMFSFF